jgi:hypothetical protein
MPIPLSRHILERTNTQKFAQFKKHYLLYIHNFCKRNLLFEKFGFPAINNSISNNQIETELRNTLSLSKTNDIDLISFAKVLDKYCALLIKTNSEIAAQISNLEKNMQFISANPLPKVSENVEMQPIKHSPTIASENTQKATCFSLKSFAGGLMSYVTRPIGLGMATLTAIPLLFTARKKTLVVDTNLRVRKVPVLLEPIVANAVKSIGIDTTVKRSPSRASLATARYYYTSFKFSKAHLSASAATTRYKSLQDVLHPELMPRREGRFV